MSYIPRDGGIRIPQGATTPKLLQPATTSGAGASIEIDPQPATTTGASGNLIVNVGAPASGSVEAGLVVERAGSGFAYIGPSNGSAGTAFQLTMGGGTGANSGSYLQESGSGFSLNGQVFTNITVGNVNYITATASFIGLNQSLQGYASGTPMKWGSSALTVAATGTTTLSAAQQQTPRLVAGVVTLTGAVTVDFGNVTGFFLLNLTNVTVSGQVVTVKNGTATQTLTAALTAGPLVIVDCAANAIAAN